MKQTKHHAHGRTGLGITAVASIGLVTLVPASATGASRTVGLSAASVAPHIERWSAAKARAWALRHRWLVGCNFVPSTAENDVEMWQSSTFDPVTIDRELGWAQSLGFNTVRVFVNYVVWKAEPLQLKQNMRRFLDIAGKHHLSTLFVLFDDCFKPDPVIGPQPDPAPGVHNSQWVQSPGARARDNRSDWPELQRYVQDLVRAFRRDRRVLAWELYNEPTQSRALVDAAFEWARTEDPGQPLTATVFGDDQMRNAVLKHSDVISFHCYQPLPELEKTVAALRKEKRPLLCTEYMARPLGSRFETHLPYFRQERIGCYNWGLVAGRTQTYFPWGSPPNAPEPQVWFHDILHKDGTPFNAREVRFIRGITGIQAPLVTHTLLPTSETTPVIWKYTLTAPPDDWMQAGFKDNAWNEGPAPFGTAEPDIGRKPGAVWTGPDIWMRHTFQVSGATHSLLTLRIQHDEDTEVYLNGVLAARLPGYDAVYETIDLLPLAAAALHAGKNTIAVHTHQTAGGQYIDVGLETAVVDAAGHLFHATARASGE